MGSGAVKKMPKRRMEAISGNFSSYARVMNNEEHMRLTMEVNEISMELGELRQEADDGRKAAAANKKAKDDERKRRQVAATATIQQRKEMIMPQLIEAAELACNNEAVLQQLGKKTLQDLLRYLFTDPPVSKISSMRVGDLMTAVKAGLEVYKANRASA